jgi:hypothetical protein
MKHPANTKHLLLVHLEALLHMLWRRLSVFEFALMNMYFVVFVLHVLSCATVITRVEGARYRARRAPCTPPARGNSSLDDTPAIHAAIASCGEGGTIVIPQGSTYHLRTTLEFTGCEDCVMQLDGTLKASDDLAYWQGKRAIIHMSGIRSAKIFSSTGTGRIDGNGLAAWEKFSADKSYHRPTLHYIEKASSDILISNLKVINPPNGTYTGTPLVC